MDNKGRCRFSFGTGKADDLHVRGRVGKVSTSHLGICFPRIRNRGNTTGTQFFDLLQCRSDLRKFFVRYQDQRGAFSRRIFDVTVAVGLLTDHGDKCGLLRDLPRIQNDLIEFAVLRT